MKKISIVYDFLKEIGGLERVMFFQANKLSKHYAVELVFGHIADKEKKTIVRELELDATIPLFRLGNCHVGEPQKNHTINGVVAPRASKKRAPLQTAAFKLRRAHRFFDNEQIDLAAMFIKKGMLAKRKTDLVISHSFMSSGQAYVKNLIDKTPYIVIMHHPPNFLYSLDTKGWANNSSRFFAKILGIMGSSFLKKKDKKYVQAANMVLANSNYTARRIREIYGCPVHVLYPPYSPFFKPLTKSQCAEFSSSKRIIRPFILGHGRVIPDKNYEFLISLLPKVQDIEFLISGSVTPSYKKVLEQCAQIHGVAHRVKIIGKIPLEDVRGYYSTAALFVMPAELEDFGITLIEALACGCPAVAWGDNAGPNEIITSVNGLLASPYHTEDFAKKINAALKKNWNKQEIIASVNKFSESSTAKQLMQYISSVFRDTRNPYDNEQKEYSFRNNH